MLPLPDRIERYLKEQALKETPDLLKVEDMVLGFDHDAALTFTFIGKDHLAISERPHTYVFNALKAFHRDGDWSVFKDYDVRFFPNKPPKEKVLEVAESLSGIMGENRRATRSGRCWINVKSNIVGAINAISFWCKSTDDISTWTNFWTIMRNKLGDRNNYVEFLDFKQPSLIVRGRKNPSDVDSTITKEQLADILSRSHVAPHTLSPKELEIAHAARSWKRKSVKHGYETDAEWNALSRMSESLDALRAKAWKRDR